MKDSGERMSFMERERYTMKTNCLLKDNMTTLISAMSITIGLLMRVS
jgi:hypothetical protein